MNVIKVTNEEQMPVKNENFTGLSFRSSVTQQVGVLFNP